MESKTSSSRDSTRRTSLMSQLVPNFSEIGDLREGIEDSVQSVLLSDEWIILGVPLDFHGTPQKMDPKKINFPLAGVDRTVLTENLATILAQIEHQVIHMFAQPPFDKSRYFPTIIRPSCSVVGDVLVIAWEPTKKIACKYCGSKIRRASAHSNEKDKFGWTPLKGRVSAPTDLRVEIPFAHGGNARPPTLSETRSLSATYMTSNSVQSTFSADSTPLSVMSESGWTPTTRARRLTRESTATDESDTEHFTKETTFRDVLAHENSFGIFDQHLCDTYCDENLGFFTDYLVLQRMCLRPEDLDKPGDPMIEFRKITLAWIDTPQIQPYEYAWLIFENYVEAGSVQEINLGWPNRSTITNYFQSHRAQLHMEPPERLCEILEPAFEEIVSLMESDSFSHFKKQQAWFKRSLSSRSDMLADVEKLSLGSRHGSSQSVHSGGISPRASPKASPRISPQMIAVSPAVLRQSSARTSGTKRLSELNLSVFENI